MAKGVRLHSCGKWTATIWFNKKSEHIGLFLTEKLAIEALERRRNELVKSGVSLSKRGENHYVSNTELMYEIIVSKAQGKLTDKAVRILMKIVKEVNRKFRYNYEDDRYDVIAYSYEVLIKNWFNFDEELYDNPFAYYTEVVKRAHAMQFKKLQKTRHNTISLDYTLENGRSLQNYI